MPGFNTFSTIFRQAAALAKYIPRTTGAAAITGRRARQAISRLAKETFPTLTESQGHLGGRSPIYALEPIRLGSRNHRPLSAHARLLASARNVRNGSTRFPRVAGGGGGRTAGNVGLGSARTFSSGPTQSAVQSNVPVVLRAFASLLSDEEVDRSLPRGSKFRPYTPRRQTRGNPRQTRRSLRCSVSSFSAASIDSHLSHYFPYRRPQTTVVPLPPTPETLITPGTTTILSLPLSPSLSALLSPSTEVPYATAEIGISILSGLTLGRLTIQEAFSLHYWHKIGPLLAKLDDLGFLGGEWSKGTRHEMILDGNGRPDILRFVFEDRSERDIWTLLGSCLKEEGGRVWWGLRDITEISTGSSTGTTDLSKGEKSKMMEVWDESPVGSSKHVRKVDQVIFDASESMAQDVNPNVALILPTLDAHPVTFPAELYTGSSWDDNDPSSLTSTPISDLDLLDHSNFASPISGVDSPSPAQGDYTGLSLTESLLSQLSALSSTHASYAERDQWAVRPSPTDSDVESSVSMEMIGETGSEIWESSSDVEVESLLQGSNANDVDIERVGSWTGIGQGFGLAQPW